MEPTTPVVTQLKIEPVIGRAEEVIRRAQAELPTHQGLATAAAGVSKSAHDAQAVSQRLKGWWGIHRVPALFVAVALLALVIWGYIRWFHVSTLTVALPTRDAVELHTRLEQQGRVRFRLKETIGSRESIRLLEAGKVDLAFVQGGLPLPAGMPRLAIPEGESVLFFLRNGVERIADVRTVLTSSENQGSHTVAQEFFRQWKVPEPIRYVHDWRTLTSDADYVIPPDVDAVFVIKDLANENTYNGAARIDAAGFRLASPNLGGRSLFLPYLNRSEIPAGYLRTEPPLPAEPVETYVVTTYLVARKGLTPRLLAEASHLLDQEIEALQLQGSEPSFAEAKDLIEAVEAFLGILVYIGVGFLALLGLEITTYRKRFNELNTIVSLISMHQSNKDVLGESDPQRLHDNLLYLSLCSDLLGLISVITGYYSQENPSLLYNKLLEIIHQRSSSLKLNIQLKILHANITNVPSGFNVEAMPPPVKQDDNP